MSHIALLSMYKCWRVNERLWSYFYNMFVKLADRVLSSRATDPQQLLCLELTLSICNHKDPELALAFVHQLTSNANVKLDDVNVAFVVKCYTSAVMQEYITPL